MMMMMIIIIMRCNIYMVSRVSVSKHYFIFIFIVQYKCQLCCRVILHCGCWSCAEESYAVRIC